MVAVDDERILVAQPDAVRHSRIGCGVNPRWWQVSTLGDLGKGRPRHEQGGVGGQLFVGGVEQALLNEAWSLAAGNPGAGDIDRVAADADEVGVEGNQVAGLDNPVRALLVPRVGSRARGKQPGFEPLAAAGDVGPV